MTAEIIFAWLFLIFPEIFTLPVAVDVLSGEAGRWLDEPCMQPELTNCPPGYTDSPPLIVISFDGFKSEYLSRNLTRSFDKIRKCGVGAKAMRPTHPAITFVNHYSIATGLHSESHGIIDNSFYDADLRRHFSYKSHKDVRDSVWFKGEPIWITARRQGKRSHSYFWVGAEAEINGLRPNEYLPYNRSHSYAERVDKVLEWISYPKEIRPDVTMLYFEEPDVSGHHFGSQSKQVTSALKHVDTTLEQLMQGLHAKSLLSCVNIVIVSDHGMSNSDCRNSITVMDILNSANPTSNITEQDFSLDGGVQGRISLTPNSNTTIDAIYHSLVSSRECSSKTAAYQVYRKEDLPRRLHYSNSARIEPIIINLKEGFQIGKSASDFCWPGGWHGYDNLYSSMGAIFMAQGPSFKAGLEIEPFQNIELYNLFCDLLAIEPAPNNGTRGSLHSLLKNPKSLLAADFRKDPQVHFSTFPVEFRETYQICFAGCKTGLVWDEELSKNMTAEESDRLLKTLAPHGEPETPKNSSTVVLINRNSLIGFSQTLKYPLWASFILQENMTTAFESDIFNPECSRTDVRLPKNGSFTCYDLLASPAEQTEPAFLIPADNSADEQTIGNVIPMYRAFKNDLWLKFWKMLVQWTKLKGVIDVQIGPIFDDMEPYGIFDFPSVLRGYSNSSGLLIPSHFFVIVVITPQVNLCTNGNCATDVIAFILPHSQKPRSLCQDDASYILTYSARVQDVEAASGLHFFTRLPFYKRTRLLTKLPTKLWHSADLESLS